MADNITPPTPSVPTPPVTPEVVYTALQISDAQKVVSDKALATNNVIITQAEMALAKLKKYTEDDLILTPQQVADGFQLRHPGLGSEVYYNITFILKLLAWSNTGILDSEYWLKREWLLVADGSLIATQVPWSPVSNTGLLIYSTRDAAIAASHDMLAAWKEANIIPARPAQVAIYAADGVTVLFPSQDAVAAKLPDSPVAFKNAL